MVHLAQQQTDLIFLVLALGDIEAAAEYPEWSPARWLLAKVCTPDPGHPAHLASRPDEAEVHFNLTSVGSARSPFILFADPGHIVPVHTRKRSFDTRCLHSWKSEYRHCFGGID